MSLFTTKHYVPLATFLRRAKRSKSKANGSAGKADRSTAKANRSTGPRTAAGKERSRYNAFRHGLTSQVVVLPNEDHEAYRKFAGAIMASLAPEGPIETQLAQRIADAQWRLNRIGAIEQNMLGLDAGEQAAVETNHPQADHAFRMAQYFADNSKAFVNLSLYEQRIQRVFNVNMKDLRELQNARRAALPATQACATAASSAAYEPPGQDAEFVFATHSATAEITPALLDILTQPPAEFSQNREIPPIPQVR